MPFCKKLDCNAKNEPPYLLTTFASFMFTIVCNRPGHDLHVDYHFPFPPSLVAVTNNPPYCCDLDRGGPSLAPLVLATICDPPIHDPHVDHHFFFPPFWLQLLVTLLVVVILILVV